jgi:hypothetical protein
MRTGFPHILRLTVIATIAAAIAAAVFWCVYERAIAGGYQWTTWQQISQLAPGPGPVSRRVFLVAQKYDGSIDADSFTPILRMPERDDFDPQAPELLVNGVDQNKFLGDDAWGSVRVWGRLHRPADTTNPQIALRITIDRMQEDPPFLFDAFAPLTWRAWAWWIIGSGLAAGFLFALAHLLGR